MKSVGNAVSKISKSGAGKAITKIATSSGAKAATKAMSKVGKAIPIISTGMQAAETVSNAAKAYKDIKSGKKVTNSDMKKSSSTVVKVFGHAQSALKGTAAGNVMNKALNSKVGQTALKVIPVVESAAKTIPGVSSVMDAADVVVDVATSKTAKKVYKAVGNTASNALNGLKKLVKVN